MIIDRTPYHLAASAGNTEGANLLREKEAEGGNVFISRESKDGEEKREDSDNEVGICNIKSKQQFTLRRPPISDCSPFLCSWNVGTKQSVRRQTRNTNTES